MVVWPLEALLLAYVIGSHGCDLFGMYVRHVEPDHCFLGVHFDFDFMVFML